MRYKVNRNYENIYIKYMGTEGSIDPILPIFGTRPSHHKNIHPNFQYWTSQIDRYVLGFI